MERITKIILVIVGVFVIGFLTPIIISFSSARLYHFSTDRLTSWDTNLETRDLNIIEFDDVRQNYYSWTDNPLQGLFDLVLIRRMKIYHVDCAGIAQNNNYHIQFYTYFNIPFGSGDYYIGGEGISCR